MPITRKSRWKAIAGGTTTEHNGDIKAIDDGLLARADLQRAD